MGTQLKHPPIQIETDEWEWKRWLKDAYNEIITPSFRVYRSADQTGIVTATPTKIQFNTEEIDTHGYWDSTTNYRFQPKIKGYYFFYLALRWNYAVAAATDPSVAYIYKNGSANSISVNFDPVGPTQTSTNNVSGIIYLDGTNDYVEFFCRQSSGVNQALFGNQMQTYAFGYKISGP
jgi:hypothetical protein